MVDLISLQWPVRPHGKGSFDARVPFPAKMREQRSNYTAAMKQLKNRDSRLRDGSGK